MWVTGAVGVVMVTSSQYVSRILQHEPEKEQPTLVTMATHLLWVHGGSSLLRRWCCALIGYCTSLCDAFTLLFPLLCFFRLFLWFKANLPFLSVLFFSSFEFVCLPVCVPESSPGPGRQSCPLRCGKLLKSLRRWRCSLDWASTGDTLPLTQTKCIC